MKKVFASALIIGLIGAPSAAFAMQGHGADDTTTNTATPQTTNVRQEDRHGATVSAVAVPATVNNSGPHSVVSPQNDNDNEADDDATTGPVAVENENENETHASNNNLTQASNDDSGNHATHERD